MILICISFSLNALSQDDWGQLYTIYNENNLKVELQFKLASNSCLNNLNNFYRYKITGKIHNYDKFLIFTIDYRNCNGELKYQQFCIDIGPKSASSLGTIVKSLDFNFVGELVKPYYDVHLDDVCNPKSGSSDPLACVAADKITGNIQIDKGTSTTLSVSGGRLGTNAQWVWYANSCGGIKIGTGPSITVTPNSSTTYFVRPEGCSNSASCVSTKVICLEKSLDPYSITSNKGSSICEGESIKLKVNGGKLADDASWKWYSGSCSGFSIGSGEELIVSPTKTTTYYVRGEGYYKTKCISITIEVKAGSISPSYISTSASVKKNRPFTISLNSGKLGDGARWEWYKGTCSPGSVIGHGTSITDKVRKETTYHVRAVGPSCGETGCISTTILPGKVRRFDNRFTPKDDTFDNKFLQLGLGFGLDNPSFSDYGTYINYDGFNNTIIDDSSLMKMRGIGAMAAFSFHPIIKDYLSFGLSGNYAVGTLGLIPALSTNSSTYYSDKEKYFYTKLNFGADLAAGYKPIKALVIINRKFQTNDYSQELYKNYYSYEKYVYNDDLNEEMVAAGFRFAGYSRKENGKRGNSFDFLYTLTREFTRNWSAFSISDYNNLPEWRMGFKYIWWRQSAFRFEFEITTNTKQKNISEITFSNSSYMISFIYNYDWFY